MTRKKYIKALMALDVSRNDANAMALAAQVLGTSYEEDYRQRAPWLRLALFSRRALRNVTAAVMRLAESITNAIAATSLQMHHPTPYTPENVADGLHHNMQIVTQAEHAAIHGRLDGYNAGTVIFDELDAQGGGGA